LLIVRILQISSARTLGGGERHLADLTRALGVRGHELFAALPPASPLHAELATLPPQHIATLPLRNALDLRSALSLARFVRRHRIEIVHAHLARDYPLAALAVGRATRAVETHSARLIITRHVLFPLGRLHRLTLRRVSRVIAVSGGVAQSLRAQRIFPVDKLRVVPNGIELARIESALRDFDREDYRRKLGAGAPLLVGTIGELSRVKGQVDFLRAAALVARRSETSIEFLVAGEDASETKQNLAELETLIADEGLRGRVRLLGRREDVPQILASLDLYVSASRSEAFGLAIVEAMACGAPVLATATDGAREIVEDGVTGLLVPVGDAEASASAMLRLLTDARQRASLSARARVRVRERWSLERMVDETEGIYAEALGE
jgi:glycosyltransferase involved in cell wall biosynthesis